MVKLLVLICFVLVGCMMCVILILLCRNISVGYSFMLNEWLSGWLGLFLIFRCCMVGCVENDVVIVGCVFV